MQHFILRCKHCQKEYTYCTYGNGPEYGTEEGCSMEYCAECQKAIDESLSKIPKKYEPRLKEISDKSLLGEFEKVREEEKLNNPQQIIAFEFENSDYDVVETYYYKNNKYKVKYYDGNKDDKHIFVDMEYDLINECFTGKKWRYNVRNSYKKQRNYMKDMVDSFKTLSMTTNRKMDEPSGQLFWMDLK